MSFLHKKSFLIGGLFILGLVVLPATIFFFQRQQTSQTRAEKTVIMSYEPTSDPTTPLQIPAGTTFTLDVYVDPGANSVSYVKTEMTYDTSKFEPAGGFIPNRHVFSQVVEGPLNTPGKITATLSIGSDLSKALKTKTKIGTLALKVKSDAAANSTATVGFGPGTQALSVSNNSNYDENVIANTTTATVQINKPQLTCSNNAPSDVMLTIDNSGSMNDKAGSSGTKLSNAKSAADNFIDILAQQAQNHIGLSTFESTGTLDSGLTSSFATVKNEVNSISASGGTCVQCGINKANQEIAAHKRQGYKNAVILLTDGRANHVEGNSREVNTATAEQAALDAAASGHSANGTVYYTIGLGNDVNSDFLTKLAEDNGGQYYFSPTTDDLNAIYTQISEILARGSVSGTVFNDANGNGVFDSNETPLSGWLLQLHGPNSQTQAITTDSAGTFSITNLCDGSYTLDQVQRDGWTQTIPSNANGYALSIANGNAVSDKDFGNKNAARCSDTIDNDGNGFTDQQDSTCHTDGNPNNPNSYDPNKDGEHGSNTCSDSKDNNGNGVIDGADPICHTDGNPNNPGSYDPNLPEASPTDTPAPTATPGASSGATLSLTMYLHGIGNSGDNANPNAYSLSNKTPVHTQRPATVWLYDISNNLIATGSGTVTYSSASGNFVGTVTTDNAVPAGKYSVKVRTDYHLTRLVGGIQTILANQTTQLPSVQMVAGDVNNDNRLDILDYNLLLDCYSDLSAAPNCDADKKLMTDLNDDDAVNQFDYNLFLREISTQPGE